MLKDVIDIATRIKAMIIRVSAIRANMIRGSLYNEFRVFLGVVCGGCCVGGGIIVGVGVVVGVCGVWVILGFVGVPHL